MSRNFRWALTAFMTMLALGAGILSVPAAAASTVAPVDASRDLCGTSNDEYYVPAVTGDYFYVSGEEQKSGDTWHSTNGALSVTVDAYDYYENHVGGPWTLTFTDAPCGDEQPNQYATEVVACRSSLSDPYYGMTIVDAEVTNVADNGAPLDGLVVRAFRSDDWDTGGDRFPSIADGATERITMVGLNNGLLPGKYSVIFSQNTPSYRVLSRVPLTVPNCGNEVAPDEPRSRTVKPKGTVKRLLVGVCARVKMVNRGVDHATVYRIKKNPARGFGRTKVFKVRVAASDVKRKRICGPPRTRVALRARVKTEDGWRLKRLDRAMLRRRR